MLVVVTGLTAALFLAAGFVVQQHVAAEDDEPGRLPPGLLLTLLRRPLWLAGIAAMVLGQLLGAVALGNGSLALVEPLLAANLLFALPMAAAWHRRRLGRREWIGAVVLIAGLGIFVAVGQPRGGDTTHLAWPNWAIAGGAIVGLAIGLTVTSLRLSRAAAATVLAAAAGCIYGLQDAITQTTLHTLHSGFTALLTDWYVYALVAIAVFGLFLAQSAFRIAPLAASLPAITIGEPLAGIAFGVGVFSEHLNGAIPQFAGEIAGIALIIAGMILLARSPIVTGERVPAEPYEEHWAAAEEPASADLH